DSGSATEEVAVGYDTDAIEIGFNAKYLLDITAQLSVEEAIFLLADAGIGIVDGQNQLPLGKRQLDGASALGGDGRDA
ncbi:hypothetical protein ACCS86_37830, partial [Rhizobium ruizarguesonis]